MSRHVISFDFDDVLFPFMASFIKFLNATRGTNYRFEDMYTFDLAEALEMSHEDLNKALDEHGENFAMSALIDPAVLEYLNSQDDDCENHIVTARGISAGTFIMSWLELSGILSYFAEIHYGELGVSKSDICKRIGARVHIEDAAHNIFDVASGGIPVIAVDKPWNRTFALPKNSVRARTWEQISVYINQAIAGQPF